MTESIAQIKSARPKDLTQSPVPPEAGNVWFLDDEPDDDTPLHWAEQLLVTTAKVIFAFVVVGCAAFLTGVLVSHL